MLLSRASLTSSLSAVEILARLGLANLSDSWNMAVNREARHGDLGLADLPVCWNKKGNWEMSHGDLGLALLSVS